MCFMMYLTELEIDFDNFTKKPALIWNKILY